MKRNHPKINTIRRRFVLIISVAVIGCMFAVQLAANLILRQIATDYSETSMKMAVERINKEIEDEYYSLLQMSQLMVRSGIIGRNFHNVLNAKDYMEKLNSMTTLREMLTTMLFSSGGQLATYYNSQSGENYLNQDQKLQKDFQPSALPILRDSTDTVFHAIHNSQSHFSNATVVSLLRKSSFSQGDGIVIYAEKQIDIIRLLSEYRQDHPHGFDFLQLDNTGCVLYSTQADIPVGSQIEQMAQPNTQFAKWDGYFWSAQPSTFGGCSVLLLPKADFYHNVQLQLWFALLAAGVSVLLILIAVVLLNELIIKKNRILEQEFDRVGNGNLEKSAQRTGLQDYDQMLDCFDWMIEQIHQQITAVEQAERHNRDIEREILYYQINPHFLLNALNSAYWQAKMNLSDGVDQYIAELTAILRYSLGKDAEVPSLRKEAQILKLYLQLQKRRRDFTYTLDIQDGSYLQIPTPRLFIQPIVENSIDHGIDEGGHITVQIYQDGAWACVQVSDNGIGMDADTLQQIEQNMERHSSRAGIGLRYVKTVITAMYGDQAQMQIESRQGEGIKVLIRLPITSEYTKEVSEHD